MLYTIYHLTKFQYSEPVAESVMEIRMQPRTDAQQSCLQFALNLKPSAKFHFYQDHHGNLVHHFDIPKRHSVLEITTDSIVEVFTPADLPETVLPQIWDEIDKLTYHPDFWEFTLESYFARPTELLKALAKELKIDRSEDALTVLKRINTALHDGFEYSQGATEVDSPIDEAIKKRGGVCQDFANIMIALVRELKIPCRYVSGYLFHRTDDRSHIAEDATHAWVEAYLPALGWIGFDPTNNLICADRHIRVAVGRDYADVPPTRGIYKGAVESELTVAVRVAAADSKEIQSKTEGLLKSPGFQSSAPKPVFDFEQQQQQ